MKYLYLPLLFTIAFGYSKYFEYSKKIPAISNAQNTQAKSRTPASVKEKGNAFNIKEWLQKL